MLVKEEELPPSPGSLQGVCFFGKTAEEAKAAALCFYGRVESGNCGAAAQGVFSAGRVTGRGEGEGERYKE